MKVTDSGYLDTQGFSVILYHSAFDRTFLDQKNTAMEMILHGRRIATNGDVRMLPTPEQWDAAAEFKDRQADKETNRLSAQLSYPEYQIGLPAGSGRRAGGVRVSVQPRQAAAGETGRAVPDSTWSFSRRPTSARLMRLTGRSVGVFPRTSARPDGEDAASGR